MKKLGKYLVSIPARKWHFAMIFPFIVAMVIVTMPLLHAQENSESSQESRMDKIRSNFDGLTTQITGLHESITEYAATAVDGVSIDDATEQAMDHDWVTIMNIVTQIIAYSKPTGTLMFDIDEALMAAEIDIKRMENSGKNLDRLIEGMKKGKTELDKMKKDIDTIHNGANEFKMRLRKDKYEYSYTKRAEQFHNIVNTMKDVVGGLSKAVSELKGVSNSKILSRSREISN